MASTAKMNLGKFGEKLAEKYLAERGCEIVARNFYTRFGEIDLIARLGDEFLFVEVKTRTSDDFGYPEEAVDRNKISRLLKAVQIYLAAKRIKGFWRLDVIAIRLDEKNKRAKVRWFKNAGEDFVF